MDFTALLEAALSFFLVVTALALAYVLLKMGGTFSRLNIFLKRLDQEVIPLLSKLQVTMEEVNSELAKVDEMMGTLVGVTDRVDATAKALQSAIVSPVKKAASLSAGVSETVSSLIGQHKRRA